MTAVQFPMYTLPIPPANPQMWNEAVIAPPKSAPQSVRGQLVEEQAERTSSNPGHQPRIAHEGRRHR